jgi:mannitol-1-/sugar-/sorbitol-6-phosphatase
VLAPHLDAVREGRVVERRQTEETEGVVALAGAAELLASAERIAIVTSGTEALARARLAAAGLRAPDVLVTADDITHGKPDPEPYLIGAERLGAAPADCVVLEDAPAGIAAGRAAGMPVIAVRTTHEDTELAGATVIVDGLGELDAALSAVRARAGS